MRKITETDSTNNNFCTRRMGNICWDLCITRLHFLLSFEFSKTLENIPFHRWQVVRVSVFLTFGYLAIRHFYWGMKNYTSAIPRYIFKVLRRFGPDYLLSAGNN